MFTRYGHTQLMRDTAEPAGGAPAPAPAPAPAEVQAPWGSSEGMWSLGEGEAATPWSSAIPEENVRTHIEAAGFKNPSELAMAHYSLTKLQRGNPNVIDLNTFAEGATPEQWGEVYQRLGRPDTADGYTLGFEDKVGVTPEQLTAAQSAFHEAGLNPQQAEAMVNMVNGLAPDGANAAEVNAQELTDLETRWDGNLEENKQAALDTIKKLGATSELIERVESNIGSAAVVEIMALIGKAGTESGSFLDTTPTANPNDPTNMTPAQAQARIAQLRADPAFNEKFTNADNPEHAQAVKTMEALYAKA